MMEETLNLVLPVGYQPLSSEVQVHEYSELG